MTLDYKRCSGAASLAGKALSGEGGAGGKSCRIGAVGKVVRCCLVSRRGPDSRRSAMEGRSRTGSGGESAQALPC